MAVPNVPFLLSQAATEFGLTGRPVAASTIVATSGLSPVAGALSRLAGRSAAFAFNFYINSLNPGYEIQVGTVNGGNVAPKAWGSNSIESIVSYSDQQDIVNIYVAGPAKAMRLDIAGAGAVTFTSNSKYSVAVSWPGIYAWLLVRIGQTVACTLRNA